jgi:hypothetical protein
LAVAEVGEQAATDPQLARSVAAAEASGRERRVCDAPAPRHPRRSGGFTTRDPSAVWLLRVVEAAIRTLATCGPARRRGRLGETPAGHTSELAREHPVAGPNGGVAS